MKTTSLFALPFLLMACQEPASESTQEATTYETTGSIEVMDPALGEVIDEDADIQVLADSFSWSEGPLWIGGEDGFVVFTDVPQNKAWKWSEEGGKELYLSPSGYTGEDREGSMEGANGLTLDLEGNLILCQHGDRRVARMMADPFTPEPTYETITDHVDGMRYNSPNDLTYSSDGTLFFTDPPYGLQFGQWDTINREIPFEGVYSMKPYGEIRIVDQTLTRPNGIALSPDESRLYVANSDPNMALWKVYDKAEDGSYTNGRMFYDATSEVGEELPGLPDGLRVLSTGEIIASGPGGIWIISEAGKPLGRILTGVPTANCEIGADGHLYITANHRLLRVKLNHL